MISVEQAIKIILNHTVDFGSEIVPLDSCLGRVLDMEITADRDFPPFDRVTMDGIAILYAQFAKGQRRFAIEGRHMAGEPSVTLDSVENCFEVMTGAILPQGTDTVIRYEDIEVNENTAEITIENIKDKQNVHRRGTDRQQDDLLIKPGTLITPAEIGVLSTVGCHEVRVKKVPRVAIISTGDELVDVHKHPLPHQIRKSNVYNLRSALTKFGIDAGLFHVADDRPATIKEIDHISTDYDVLMLSGGVSKGKADYVPEALESLGYEKLLHRIKQRPGKPFWFGVGKENKVVFAFPGNPVSTFLCFRRYFYPWIEHSLGTGSAPASFARLTEDVQFVPELTYFLQVATSYDPVTGTQLAQPVEGHGSGDLANLLDSNAFLQLPPDRTEFKAGEVFPLLSFKP